VTWKLSGLPDPNQRWYTLGTNWNMSSNSMLKFFFQYSDLDAKGIAGGWGLLGLGGAQRYTGGLIGTQLSLKF